LALAIFGVASCVSIPAAYHRAAILPTDGRRYFGNVFTPEMMVFFNHTGEAETAAL